MNQPSNFKKGFFFVVTPILVASCALGSVNRKDITAEQLDSLAVAVHTSTTTTPPVKKKKIKIALLLDTSNSMDGLINQAKSQLWKLVNELALAKCENEKPELEIALYEYGNDGLSSEGGFIRQVSEFTNDLDLISEKLFALRTNGGSEYCGQVISVASQQLEWQKEGADLQIMFIAGNESFHQGTVSSYESCRTAKEKDIIVNTIYCGNFEEGLNLGWKNGADLTQGSYMSINHNSKTVYIETPYDNEIAQMNDKLNATYVNYGAQGYEKKANQLKQDKNAESYGTANSTNRVVSKAGKFYSNSSWDLVDAAKNKDFDVATLKESELPSELKGKTLEEKKQYIAMKTKEREEVIKQIETLNAKRNAFIAEKTKTMGTASQSLDAAMLNAIRKQAALKNFVFEM